jgi:hypothetical protein
VYQRIEKVSMLDELKKRERERDRGRNKEIYVFDR